jgi:hypothetical protein
MREHGNGPQTVEVVPVRTPSRAYDVHVGCGILDHVGTLVRDAAGGEVAAVVADSTVAPLYAAQVQASLAAAGYRAPLVVFPAGERNKRFSTLEVMLEDLAEAEDDLQPRRESGSRSLVDRLVGLAEVLSSLAVTDDDVLRARLQEHIRGDLTGERALFLKMDVLRADLHVRALRGVRRGGDVDEGNAEDDLASRFAIGQLRGLLHGFDSR